MKKCVRSFKYCIFIMAALSVAFITKTVNATDGIFYDYVQLNVEPSCTISRTGNPGSGSSTGTWTYTATLQNNTTNSNVGTSTFQVNCNDTNGWRITAQGWDGTSSSTNLTHTTDDTFAIPTGTSTASTDSSWAMKLTPGTNVTLDGGFVSGVFKAVPSVPTRIAYYNTSAQEFQPITITYQVHISAGQSMGTYAGGVKYHIDSPSAPDLMSISTMQDMTPEICAATATPSASALIVPTTQLTDTRDGKKYWVAKLADGNCWMTQNLDFEISSSGTNLTTLDSDVTSNKTLTNTYWSSDPYVSNVVSEDKGNSYRPNGCQSLTSASSLPENSTDWHYHVGNYYSWLAATAGSGTSSVISTDAPESICPKGWRLPTSNSTTANYSFGKLANAYSNIGALQSAPLWFNMNGYVYTRGDITIYEEGSSNLLWSSMANSDFAEAYYLSSNMSSINPSVSDWRNNGLNIRCVAK